MKINAFFLRLFFLIKGFSLTSQTVQYKTILDDPGKLKPVVISFDILTADTWGTNSFMGYGLRADINILKYGSVHVDYRKAYLDGNAKKPDNLSAARQLKKHRSYELGFSFNLFKSEKKKSLDVILSSSTLFYGNKMLISGRSISVPGTKANILQLRGGIANFRAAIDESPEYDAARDKFDQRTLFLSKDTASVVVGYGTGYKGVYGIKAQMRMMLFYAGISWRTITNLVISHTDSKNGIASHSNNYNFFADALFGGNPVFSNHSEYSITDVVAKNFPKNTNLTEWELSSSKTKKIGWRLGWEAKINNGVGMTYKVEFGSRPGYTGKKGILSPNAYLMLTAGFSIPVGKSNKKLARDSNTKTQ